MPATESKPSLAWRLADWMLAAGLLALVCLLGCFLQIDTDIWWHLKAGRQMLAGGGIPQTDTYTFGATGRSWIDLHWGFQLAAAWLYERGGMALLTLGSAGAGTLAVAICLLAGGRPRTVELALWLPLAFLVTGRFYVRPEILTLLCLAIWLVILRHMSERPRLAWLLVPVQLVWVNVQGLFILGPALLGFWWVEQLARRMLGRAGAWSRHWVVATASVAAACFVNPYTWRGALFPIALFRKMSVEHAFWGQHIGELRSVPSFVAEYGLRNPYVVLHLAVLVLAAASFVLPLWARRLPLFRLLVFAAFAWLGLQATRSSGQFALAAGCVLTWNVTDWRAERAKAARPVRGAWAGRAGLAALLLAAIGWVASGRFYEFAGEGRRLGLGEQPWWHAHDAARFAARPGLPRHWLAFHEGQAAVLEFHMRPDQRVYCDPRLEVMPQSLMQLYYDLAAAMARPSNTDRPDWRAQLARMPQPLGILADHRGHSALQAALIAEPGWRCVWFDAVAGVYVPSSMTDLVRAQDVDFGAMHFHPAAAERVPLDPERLLAESDALIRLGGGVLERPLGDRRIGYSMLLGATRRARAALAARSETPRTGRFWTDWLAGSAARPATGFGALRNLGIAALQLYSPASDRAAADAHGPASLLGAARARFCFRRAAERGRDDFALFTYQLSAALAAGDLESVADLARALRARGERTRQEQLVLRPLLEQAATRTATLDRSGPVADSATPRNLDELTESVERCIDEGRLLSAVRLLQAASGPPGDSPWAGKPLKLPWALADRLGWLYLATGDPVRARAVWQDQISGEFDTARRDERIAFTWLVEGDLPAAMALYQAALRRAPQFADAQWGLALCLLEAGDASGVLRECDWALRDSSLPARLAEQFRWMRMLAEPYAKPVEPAK
jgi:tetratricopeptide (TPR) repeat protein